MDDECEDAKVHKCVRVHLHSCVRRRAKCVWLCVRKVLFIIIEEAFFKRNTVCGACVHVACGVLVGLQLRVPGGKRPRMDVSMRVHDCEENIHALVRFVAVYVYAEHTLPNIGHSSLRQPSEFRKRWLSFDNLVHGNR